MKQEAGKREGSKGGSRVKTGLPQGHWRHEPLVVGWDLNHVHLGRFVHIVDQASGGIALVGTHRDPPESFKADGQANTEAKLIGLDSAMGLNAFR